MDLFIIAAALIAILCLLWLTSALVLLVYRRRVPPPYGFVNVNGVDLHYFEKGSGPPVVLVHGSNGSLQDFKLSVMDMLSTSFRSMAFDRPGHGLSQRSPGKQTSCAVHGDLVRTAWKKLGVERPVLVGHSSAGAVLMDIAVRHPEDVAAVVLISGVVYSYEGQKVPVMGLFRLLGRRFLGTFLLWTLLLPLGSLVGRWLLKFTFAPNPVPKAYRRLGLALALRPSALRAEAEDLECLSPTLKAIEGSYHDIAIPVFIVVGDMDKNVPPETESLRLARDLPSAKLVRLPSTGHMPMFIRPQEVVDAVHAAWESSLRPR